MDRGTLDRIFEIGFWIGFGEVWTRQLIQTLSETYLGCPRDKFYIGFEQVVWSNLPHTPSQSRSRKIMSSSESETLPQHSGNHALMCAMHLDGRRAS